MPLPAVLNDIELGPACQKLSEKRLAFVASLVFDVPSGPGATEAAAKIVGYSAKEAKHLARDKLVVAAVKELLEQRMILQATDALDTLKDEMKSKGKDRIKSAQIILDRVLPTKQQLTVDVNGPVDRTAETLKHLQHMIDIGATEEMLINEFGELGLKHYRGLLEAQKAAEARTIDGEYTIVGEITTAQPEEAVVAQTDEAEATTTETLDDLL